MHASTAESRTPIAKINDGRCVIPASDACHTASVTLNEAIATVMGSLSRLR